MLLFGAGLVILLMARFGGELTGTSAASQQGRESSPTASPTPDKSEKPSDKPSPSASSSAPAAETSKAPSTDPKPKHDEKFAQKLDNQWGGRFDSKGLEGDNLNEVHNSYVELLGHNAAALSLASEQTGNGKYTVGQLVTKDRKYLSPKGEEVYSAVVTDLKSADKKLVTAPASWYNTSMVDGKAAVYGESGVTGNRSAIQYNTGKEAPLVVMRRCGNVVAETPPQIPTTPVTDNPPKETPEKPKPPTQPPATPTPSGTPTPTEPPTKPPTTPPTSEPPTTGPPTTQPPTTEPPTTEPPTEPPTTPPTTNPPTEPPCEGKLCETEGSGVDEHPEHQGPNPSVTASASDPAAGQPSATYSSPAAPTADPTQSESGSPLPTDKPSVPVATPVESDPPATGDPTPPTDW